MHNSFPVYLRFPTSKKYPVFLISPQHTRRKISCMKTILTNATYSSSLHSISSSTHILQFPEHLRFSVSQGFVQLSSASQIQTQKTNLLYKKKMFSISSTSFSPQYEAKEILKVIPARVRCNSCFASDSATANEQLCVYPFRFYVRSATARTVTTKSITKFATVTSSDFIFSFFCHELSL